MKIEHDSGLRVLHVAQPRDGGVPHRVIDLVHDQQQRGWDVSVACPPESDVALAFEASPMIHAWPATRSPGLTVPAETRRLTTIVKNVSPDIIHLHSSKAGLAGRLAVRAGRATIFQPHGWSFDAVDGITKVAATAWERIAARWVDAVVCVSDAEREAGVRRGVPATWFVVPNGVDLGRFKPASNDVRTATRRSLQIPERSTVVCVGRLSDAKGQDILIDLWPDVLANVPDAQLILVGEGPDRPSLERAAGRSVVFAGARLDVPQWFVSADVVAIPSRREGMSLAMLEAMASARSVVTTDVPGAREALSNEAGAVVPLGDRTAFVEALVQRLRDPELALTEGRNGRRRAERYFDAHIAADRVARLYDDVLEKRRAGR